MGRTYGYEDTELVTARPRWGAGRMVALVVALLFILGVWLALNQKLLFGGAWLSETYDNEEWRTNEGNLHTFGAWDLEAHVWKTEYIMENFPNFHWNPYWYLGMPLLKYYQLGFYALHWAVIAITGFSAPRAATLLIIFSHLLAVLLTFLLCYKISRRIWVSALCSTFLLANTFVTLRSYGWEPITVVFLFLYPLGLLLFLKEPLRPFRFWMVIVLGLSYLSHPLLWFSLCMVMGLYLFAIAIRRTTDQDGANRHYIWQYIALVLCSIVLGAVQFVPQATYEQVTSGAHMGVTYLPFYQVPYNIISLKDFFFDAGNLKGPGPIIMIAAFLLAIFAVIEWRTRRSPRGRMIRDHDLITGLTFALFLMVLFYYLELHNIFPMNFLRSIQYHRIIPEFVITAAALVAALSNIAYTYRHKVIYYTMLVTFVAASGIIIYNVQAYWATTDDLSTRPEFIHEQVEGRISFPYTDQSLSVRNSFTEIPQVYGYYEQGITNPYADELFSVSSGFHNADLTMVYLQAANVGRLYVNMEEGERDRIVMSRMNSTLGFNHANGSRYAYFSVPIADASFAQAVSAAGADAVQAHAPGCRIKFQERYCGSNLEEFVSTDEQEARYLREYVRLLEKPYAARAAMAMQDPDHYLISVSNAAEDTAVVVKMTYDKDFTATVGAEQVPIEEFGPGFMLIRPGGVGDYEILLEYNVSREVLVGAIISASGLVLVSVFFLIRRFIRMPQAARFRRGDME